MARSIASVDLGPSPSVSEWSNEGAYLNEDSQSFVSKNKPRPATTSHQRNQDFGLLLVGPVLSGATVSPEWGIVEVIEEHTNEKEPTHDKLQRRENQLMINFSNLRAVLGSLYRINLIACTCLAYLSTGKHVLFK